MAERTPIAIEHPITKDTFLAIADAVREAGYGHAIEWSERAPLPADADAFAREAVYVICNSGMSNFIAAPIAERCMVRLRKGKSVRAVYGHPGKAKAIDRIWKKRHALFAAYQAADDKIAFLATLPWIGKVTKFHLAKNLGFDVAKPDVHLNRLADAEGVTAQELCERLGRESSLRAATVDTILWRACADGLIDMRELRSRETF